MAHDLNRENIQAARFDKDFLENLRAAIFEERDTCDAKGRHKTLRGMTHEDVGFTRIMRIVAIMERRYNIFNSVSLLAKIRRAALINVDGLKPPGWCGRRRASTPE
ncbi:MAG: hypothetical protein NTV46_04020 [Verrucomicrobia bacterium]|nr:hypothetical protein [Verrucomicrobiota bacterium]